MNPTTERVLEHPWVYRAWQSPLADQKFAPILAHNDLSRVRCVLDVGCGPGTNTKYFGANQYLGVDINGSYIRDAARHHGRDFIAADVRAYQPPSGSRFDFILVNSFLHHVNENDTRSILSHLNTLLSEDGHVHVLELAMPPTPSIARVLARWDRGKFARPAGDWYDIFTSIFEPVLFEPYTLSGVGIPLWKMLYFKGRRRL